MKLKQILTDEEAVSPVIGVILMVAITVILAAVIGTFVLGLGGQVSEAQPSANIQFSYENINDGTDRNDLIRVTHQGGDQLSSADLNITAAGTVVYSGGSLLANADTSSDDNEIDPTGTNNWDDTSISAGDEIVIQEYVDDTDGDTIDESTNVFGGGDTVRVIWSGESGDTAIIGQSTVS